MQLGRVDVDIENVLKGDVPLGRNSVYYFIPTKVSGPPLLSLFRPDPFRLLLCLRNDSGKLRVASDFNPHCELRVFSGAHPAFRRESAQPVAKSIVDLLLTPGEGTDPGQMMDAILYSRLRMLPAEYVAPKLLEIAAAGAPDISAAACLMLREVITDNIAPKQKALALNLKLGISPQDADKWRAESLLRAGLVSDWWKPSDLPASTLKMKAPRDAEATLRFCRSDAALGIRPLPPLKHHLRTLPDLHTPFPQR